MLRSHKMKNKLARCCAESSPTTRTRSLDLSSISNGLNFRCSKLASAGLWWRGALLTSGIASSACSSGSVENAAGALAANRAEVRRLLGGRSGLVVVINPVTCAYNASMAQVLNDLAQNDGIRVHVVFVGVAPDTLLRSQLVRDFDFKVPATFGDVAHYSEILAMKSAQPPFAAIVDNTGTRSTLEASGFDSLSDWAHLLLTKNFRHQGLL